MSNPLILSRAWGVGWWPTDPTPPPLSDDEQERNRVEIDALLGLSETGDSK